MLQSIKKYLETLNLSISTWLIGVSGILMVRFFLESLSNPSSTGFFASDASTLIHYWLFFMSVAIIYLVLIQKLVPEWKNVAPQMVAIAFIMIFIAPIVDFLISFGEGFRMTYINYSSFNDLMISFFTIGGLNIKNGATLGLKIEIFLFVIGFGTFVYFVSKNFKKALFSAIVLYSTIFCFAYLPSIVSVIVQGKNLNYDTVNFFKQTIITSWTISNNIHSSLIYGSTIRMFDIAFNFIMGKILFIVLLVGSFVWFNFNFKEKFKAVLKNSRPERVGLYILMIFFGMFSAYIMFPNINLNWNDWLSVVMLCLSLYFSAMFAICTNDLVDKNIDKISNPERPLIKGSLNEFDMKQIAIISILASLLTSFLAGYTSFFFMLTFTALYYIYSVPPTRFKLIPFLSSFIIGLCFLAVVLAGFYLISPVKEVSVFPTRMIIALVVLFFFFSHIRDVKDIEGDKIAGIKTVPIIFGNVWGTRVVGIFASIAFLLIPVFSKIYILFIPSIICAISVYYFVNKKPYKEKYVFMTFFGFIIFAFISLLI